MNPHPVPPTSPARPRPSAWWFAVPTVLFVAAAVAFGVLLWSSVQSAMETDAEVPVDGQAHTLTIPADVERTVYVARFAPDPTCSFRDTVSGQELALGPVTGSFTRSNPDGEWRAAWMLAPSSGSVEALCQGDGGTPVQLAPPVDIGRFVGGIFATVLVPMALAGLGLLSVIVLVVLFVTRRPQHR